MMNIEKFTLEVINKNGLKYEIDSTVNAVAYNGHKIVNKGYLFDFTGRQPYLSELENMIRLADKYGILMILDRNRYYIDLNRDFKKVTAAIFIDLAAYQQMLADMTKEVSRLEEIVDYLQENKTLMKLMKDYSEDVLQLKGFISMARDENKVDEVLSEVNECLTSLDVTVAKFLRMYDKEEETVEKDVVENLRVFLAILCRLFNESKMRYVS